MNSFFVIGFKILDFRVHPSLLYSNIPSTIHCHSLSLAVVLYSITSPSSLLQTKQLPVANSHSILQNYKVPILISCNINDLLFQITSYHHSFHNLPNRSLDFCNVTQQYLSRNLSVLVKKIHMNNCD